MHNSKHTAIVKSTAKNLGFDFCGISKADFLNEEAPRLEDWLKKRRQGEMAYMENYFDKRLDPRLLVDDAKSVISLLYNYYPSKHQKNETGPRISKYAYGTDYHLVVRDQLNLFLDTLREKIGQVNGRAFVDSAPVLEKAWGAKSGLGWIGKNANLINKERGSFFFLAELIVDLDLEYDGPIKDYCGTCTRCIDACPTDAIVEPYVVDGSKCISYLTIELKEAIPEEFAGKMEGWAFGCDICQDVCPWNSFSVPHQEKQFEPRPEILNYTESQWQEVTEDTFGKIFKDSPIKRTKFRGFKRNLEFIRRMKEV